MNPRALVLALALSLVGVSQAAPLFPPPPGGHWAQESVAALAARGLLEGYPDGTFKGDRVASRWELAMVVARLLATLEKAHAQFVTRAELQALRQLAESLRPELEALGVSASGGRRGELASLEEGVGQLDQRVTELERIKFYGSLDAKAISSCFRNTGQTDNDNRRGGAGLGPVPYLDYNQLVGTGVAFNAVRPQNQGVLPLAEVTGRPLVNGASFTARALLGLKLDVSPEVDAGAEFVAYSMSGSDPLGAYYGVPQPYLCNPTGGLQVLDCETGGTNNTPFTKMVLDNFWVVHKPSNIRLVLGSFDNVTLDPMVYLGQANLNLYGPRRINYGFQVTGVANPGEGKLQWEVIGSRFGDSTNHVDAYQHYVVGADVAYQFGAPLGFGGGQLPQNIPAIQAGALPGEVKLSYARIWNEDSSLVPGQTPVGLSGAVRNEAYGNSAGYTGVQWVNPPGYFANQRSSFERSHTGAAAGILVPNTFDTRPIPGWNGAADNAVGIRLGGGAYGPQDQTTLGMSGHYDFGVDDAFIRLAIQGGHSTFKPNRNSSYSAGGNALRIDLSGTLLRGDLDLGLYYLSVDPTYNPYFVLSNALGFRIDRTFNFYYSYPFEANVYPQNREGPQFRGRYSFDDRHGEVTVFASYLRQKRTSLYDVRVNGGALGPAIPTNDVVGFSPGFADMVFEGYAYPGQYGPRSSSSFTDKLQPLEDPRGAHSQIYLGGWYRWDEPGLRLNWSLEHTGFYRPSRLTPNMGGSQNQVDLDIDYAALGLTWTADDTWTVRGGAELQLVRGHDDPVGNYNGYAVANNSVTFKNIDTLQTIPYLGVDVKLSPKTTCSLDARYYFADDRLGPNVFAGRGEGYRGFTEHPFSWEGIQISTEFHLKF